MPNFRVIEGEPVDYWDDYENFIKLYNSNKISVKDLRKKLDISQNKYRKYREKALNENRLNIDLRSPEQYRKKGGIQKQSKTPEFKDITRKQDKIFKYIEFTWYDIHCKDKKEVRKIIGHEIMKHPEMDFDKLCLHCKRKCMAEL